MALALYKQALRICCFCIAATFFLSACSPKLDWRVVQSPQERYAALFPGKPDKIQRRVTYQDQELLQSLEALKIDDDIYAVSVIDLSKDQTHLLPQLLLQLQNNLFNRANVCLETAISSTQFYETASHQKISTQDFYLEFPSTGAIETSMRVRWIIRPKSDGGSWIYQLSVLHSAPARVDARSFFSEEAYANFFDGFRPD